MSKIGGNGDFPGGSGVKNQQPMQETQVRSLVPEGPTCQGATEPQTTQLRSLCSRAQEPQPLKPSRPPACALLWEATTMRGPCPAAGEGLRAATKIQHNQNAQSEKLETVLDDLMLHSFRDNYS